MQGEEAWNLSEIDQQEIPLSILNDSNPENAFADLLVCLLEQSEGTTNGDALRLGSN